MIYKICSRTVLTKALVDGSYLGSADDARDGFIHMSTVAQLPGTLAKHFSGQTDLVVLAVDERRVQGDLRWESSRGGQLFPHLYGPLPAAAVVEVHALPLDLRGLHILPEGLS